MKYTGFFFSQEVITFPSCIVFMHIIPDLEENNKNILFFKVNSTLLQPKIHEK